ncbi:MAG: type I-E CRISPR-associated protein Cse2/CasB [Planctomycetota bacterium]
MTQHTTAAAPESLASRLAELAGLIERSDPGTRAALRRADPRTEHGWRSGAFYRLTAGLDPQPWQEPAWAVLLAGMACIEHVPKGPPFGALLAEHAVSELRLARLLGADRQQLPTQVRSLVHLLQSKGVTRCDWYQPAQLVLFDSEAARRQIARAFYRTHHQKTTH